MTISAVPVRTLVAATPPWVPAIGAALLAVLFLPQGADWPAQLFRAELFRQEGLAAWNGQWYGGHPTVGYSVLFPPLGAWLGITVVGIISILVATVCFHRLVAAAGHNAWPAATLLGLTLVPNLVIGRITFGLGLAIGLTALLALQRERRILGGVLAFATPLASPVAAVFLALAVGGWTLSRARAGDRRGTALLAAISALAVVPILATMVVFPSGGGEFGFPTTWFLSTLAASVGLALLAWHSGLRPLMYGALLYAAASVLIYAIPNAMGGNMWRLAMFFAVPLALAALPRWDRDLAIALAAIGLVWTWQPAVGSVLNAHGDPSASRAFHEPLIQQITQAGGPPGRLEIPFTKNHWEAFYVAAEVPIARGWERQTDRERNELFYEPSLSTAEYREWIDTNAVRWVAMPRVGLDHGARTEAAVLARRPEWLTPVWSNTDWRLLEVSDATPLVAAPARRVEYTSSGISFVAPKVGPFRVRARHSRHWSVTVGDACVAPADDGMMLIAVREPGPIVLRQAFYPSSAC